MRTHPPSGALATLSTKLQPVKRVEPAPVLFLLMGSASPGYKQAKQQALGPPGGALFGSACQNGKTTWTSGLIAFCLEPRSRLGQPWSQNIHMVKMLLFFFITTGFKVPWLVLYQYVKSTDLVNKHILYFCRPSKQPPVCVYVITISQKKHPKNNIVKNNGSGVIMFKKR